MQNKHVNLTVRELHKILEHAQVMGCDRVDIAVENTSGIGTTVTATYPSTLNGIDGKFSVEISGVSTW